MSRIVFVRDKTNKHSIRAILAAFEKWFPNRQYYVVTPQEGQSFIENNDVAIGIIAVPAEYAQYIADILVETKIKGILNFAPVVLTIPDNVEVRNVDLTVNLEVLTYNIEKN